MSARKDCYYDIIRRQSVDLLSDKPASKRRTALKTLGEILGESRQRLVDAVDGNILQKKAAVTALWKSILLNAHKCVRDFFSGSAKGKANALDVEMLTKLVRQFLLTKDQMDPNMAPTLSKKVASNLLLLCLENLECDEEKAPGSEVAFLGLLSLICSRKEFVAFFGKEEITKVFSELEARLDVNSAVGNITVVEKTARVWEDFLTTLCQKLGVGMQLWMQGCIELVSYQCIHHSKNGTRRMHSQLLKGAAILMMSHPEQAIEPLRRDGGHMLKHAISRYASSDASSKDTVIYYFHAHLRVCQSAGRLQGLWPGDLGNLDSASLDLKRAGGLLNLIATKEEFEKIRVLSSSRSLAHVNSIGTLNVSRHSINEKTFKISGPRSSKTRQLGSLCPRITPRQCRHLELCARLLSISQRMYLSETEWERQESLVDGEQDLLDVFLNDLDYNEAPETQWIDKINSDNSFPSPSDYVKSPFGERVLLSLWVATPREQTGFGSDNSNTQLSSQNTEQRTKWNDTFYDSLRELNSITEAFSDACLGLSPQKSVIPALQLICACSEAFPLGECWASRSRVFCHEGGPKKLEKEAFHSKRCSRDDLALVVYAVSNLLESHGGPGCEVETQSWIIRCLLRLTECTELIVMVDGVDENRGCALSFVWRRVWDLLFLPALCYRNYTRAATVGSIGDLVLVLLTEIVRCSCTSATFRDRGFRGSQTNAAINQIDIWRLPIFKDSLPIETPSVFDLISCVLFRVGLVDSCSGTLNNVEPTSSQSSYPAVNDQIKFGLRYKLLCLCLSSAEGVLQSNQITSHLESFLAKVSACMVSLISGNPTCYPTVFQSHAFQNQATTFPGIDEAGTLYNFTTFRFWDHLVPSQTNKKSVVSQLVSNLWNHPINIKTWCTKVEGDDMVALGRQWALELQLTSLNASCKYGADFIPTSESENLRSFATECIKVLLSESSAGSTKSNGVVSSDGGDESALDDSGSTSASMVHRLRLTKLLVTSSVSPDPDRLFQEVDMKMIFARIAGDIDGFNSNIPKLCQKADDFLLAAESITQLLQVWLMLSAISPKSISSARKNVEQSAMSMFSRCSDMLWNFHSSRLQGHSKQHTFIEMKTSNSNDDNLSGSDSEEKNRSAHPRPTKATREKFSSDESNEESRGRKRKKSTVARGSRRRTSSTTYEPPSLLCAIQLANIAILLQPTYECCKTLYCQIALLDAAERRDTDNISQVDVCGGMWLLHLLSSELPVFSQSRVERSIVSLFSDAIREIRYCSDAHSSSFLAGFDELINLVQNISSDHDENGISASDSRLLIEPLISFEPNEKTALKLRPQLTQNQQRAAAKIFQMKSENIHNEFDQDFSKLFVRQYLGKLSEPVRIQSSFALGYAFWCFKEQKAIFRSVVDVLLVDEKRSNSEKDLFKVIDRPKRVPRDTLDGDAWNDAILAWQSSTILCWGVIGGTTTDRQIMRTIIFDLVSLAADRPYLELMCYKALKKIAQLRGITNCSRLIRDQMGYLIQQWFETGKHILDMPLIMTGTGLVEHLLSACGPIRKFWPFHNERKGSICGFMNFRSDVVKEFVTAKASLILSSAFAFSGVVLATHLSSAIQPNTPLSEDPVILACQILADTNEDTTVGDLVISHLGEIMAFAIHCDRSSEKGIRMVHVVEELLVKCNEHDKKTHASRAIRQLVHIIGSEEYTTRDELIFPTHSFTNLLVKVGGLTMKAEIEPLTFLDTLNSNSIEYLLQARHWLDEEEECIENQLKRWKTIESIGETIFEEVNNSVYAHKVFFVRIVLEILRDCHFIGLQPVLINWLQGKKPAVISLNNSDSTIAYEMVGTLVQVHENAQDAMIAECTCAMREVSSATQRGNGILIDGKLQLAHNSLSDTWGWDMIDDQVDQERTVLSALQRYISTVSKSVLSTARQTYQLIESILENMTFTDMQQAFLLRNLGFSVFPKCRQQLREIDAKYYAQTLLHLYIRSEADLDPAQCCQRAFQTLKHVRAAATPVDLRKSYWRSSNSNQLSLNSRFLVDTLFHLQKSLQQCRMLKVAVTIETAELIQAVIDIMVESRYPESIHLQASRVLGELDTSQIESSPKIITYAPLEWLAGSDPNESSLRVSMQSMCLTLLAQLIISEGARPALVALEALKELLATQQGILCFKTLNSSVYRDLFKSFLLSTGKVKPFLLAPSPQHLAKLPAFKNLENKIKERDGEWCWDQVLWCCTSRHDYDDWVKNVVGAMIWCCYGKSKHGIKGKASFFRACLKVSLMEHTFAEALFPFIVLDLLLSASVTSTSTPVVQGFCIGHPHSAANIKLSGCFDNLLSSDPNSKATTLATSCLDMLRRANLHLFLGTRQKPNVGKIEKKLVEISDLVLTSTHAVGVVLQVNPLKTLNAFIAAKQFSSAIFFAETQIQTARPEKQAEILPVLKNCYLRLQEYDTVEALILKNAAYHFLDEKYSFGSDRITLTGPADRLQHLEALKKEHDVKKSSMLAIECLDDLGLTTIMSACIEVLSREGQDRMNLTHGDQRFLKEKWSKMNLNNRLWNSGKLTDLSGSQEEQQLIGSTRADDLHCLSQNVGFYQILSCSLSALDREDSVSLHESSIVARTMLIRDFVSFSQETILEDLALFTERLKVYNELDVLVNFDDKAVQLLKYWSTDGVPSLPCHLDLTSNTFPELSYLFREFTMNIFLRKSPTWRDLDVPKLIASHLRRCLSLSRMLEAYPVSEGALKRLKHLYESSVPGMDNDTLLMIRYEEIFVLETQGYFEAAIQGAKLIMNELESQSRTGSLTAEMDALRADSMLICGHWMKKYKVDSAKHIQEAILLPTSQQCRRLYDKERSRPNASRAFAAHVALAETSATLYEHASIRMKSREWTRKMTFLESRKEEYDRAKRELQMLQSHRKGGTQRNASGNSTADESALTRTVALLKREIGVLEAEKVREECPIDGNLQLALENFGLALAISQSSSHESSSGHVFQMVTLWFDSWQEKGFSTNVMVKNIEEIPSFRFVPLTYQIFSRLDRPISGVDFQNVLRRLVERMCNDHPYHCLPQLFALCNGNETIGVHDAKVDAAKSVLRQLCNNTNDIVQGLVDSYAVLIEASIQLALAPTKEFTDLKQPRLKDINISEMTIKGKPRLDNCLEKFPFRPCILTRPPVLQADKKYGNGQMNPLGSELICGFGSKLSITETGVHRPKIVICIGKSGNQFKQLVKGDDDMRQDAVMQQVFRYVNSLMKRLRPGHSGKKPALTIRKLQLVTYNIVPLDPKTGVLEWVENTIPFGDYLVDKGKKPGGNAIIGAHSRYYPGQWGNSFCRKHLAEAEQSQKRQAYDTICHNFSPAFRFFFVERFASNLQEMHHAKIRYTRSCAVSSIVGHMLGIGDRHSQNILIHQRTGEVVHIDFGIVFEQGRELQVPETVPFRLTRDIVDGMGPTETSGSFSRAAEETVQVLRENSKALLTILSAIVADPLYKWKESAEKARKRQQVQSLDAMVEGHSLASRRSKLSKLPDFAEDDIEEGNEAGTRAISKIQEKLQGLEEGTSSERQSVEGQVQLLINAARDPDNLCALFPGWSPWL